MLRAVVVLVLLSGVALAHDRFPMTAAAYKSRIAQKAERYRQRLEERMKEHRLPEDKRKVARKRLATLEGEIDKLADEACKDQTVTQAEADRIKERSKQGREVLYKELGWERKKGE